MKLDRIQWGNDPVRVNLKCGPMAPPGWINVDGSPNVLLDRVRMLKSGLRMVGLLSDAHMTPWAHPLMRPSRRQKIASVFGGSTHRWQPTRSLVTALLKDTEFTQVRECEFLQGDPPHLANVEHREESFFLEAV